MEILTKTNPLGLQIGDIVQASATVSFDYDADNNKKMERHRQYCSPFTCIVVGIKKKAIGKYVRSSSPGTYYDEPPENYSYLQVSKYITVYECREAINKKSVLVHPDDIKMKENSK